MNGNTLLSSYWWGTGYTKKKKKKKKKPINEKKSPYLKQIKLKADAEATNMVFITEEQGRMVFERGLRCLFDLKSTYYYSTTRSRYQGVLKKLLTLFDEYKKDSKSVLVPNKTNMKCMVEWLVKFPPTNEAEEGFLTFLKIGSAYAKESVFKHTK